MRLYEISPVKPLTPEQARVKSLQAQADKARRAVRDERDRQKIAKAQLTISQANISA